jgi:hypothetical protein
MMCVHKFSGSVTFLYRSGSADLYQRVTDPDHCSFQDANKQKNLVYCMYICSSLQKYGNKLLSSLKP